MGQYDGNDKWTVAWRKCGKGQFSRACDWSGTWDEAYAMASMLADRLGEGYEVRYTTTYAESVARPEGGSEWYDKRGYAPGKVYSDETDRYVTAREVLLHSEARRMMADGRFQPVRIDFVTAHGPAALDSFHIFYSVTMAAQWITRTFSATYPTGRITEIVTTPEHRQAIVAEVGRLAGYVVNVDAAWDMALAEHAERQRAAAALSAVRAAYPTGAQSMSGPDEGAAYDNECYEDSTPGPDDDMGKDYNFLIMDAGGAYYIGDVEIIAGNIENSQYEEDFRPKVVALLLPHTAPIPCAMSTRRLHVARDEKDGCTTDSYHVVEVARTDTGEIIARHGYRIDLLS